MDGRGSQERPDITAVVNELIFVLRWKGYKMQKERDHTISSEVADPSPRDVICCAAIAKLISDPIFENSFSNFIFTRA